MRIKSVTEKLPWSTLKLPVQTTLLFTQVKKRAHPAEVEARSQSSKITKMQMHNTSSDIQR